MRLSDWMSKHEVDDEELASRVGSDRSTISRIRRGKRRPSWDLAEKIKASTGNAVTPDDYLSEPAATAKPQRRRKRAA
jgi:transcriptional regulator with XRE-family HTH domain